MTHLKTCTGGKKCSQSHFASSQAGNLRSQHTFEKSQRNATNVTGRCFEETFETHNEKKTYKDTFVNPQCTKEIKPM